MQWDVYSKNDQTHKHQVITTGVNKKTISFQLSWRISPGKACNLPTTAVWLPADNHVHASICLEYNTTGTILFYIARLQLCYPVPAVDNNNQLHIMN